MDFVLNERQEALRTLAREFAEREIAPIALERDRATPRDADVFSWDIVRKGSALGLRTLAVPEEYGGAGADRVTQVLVMEELSRADAGISKTFSQNWKWTPILTQLMTPDQRHHFLPLFTDNPTCLLAMGQTEPGAGSDNVIPYDEAGAGLLLRAERDGDHYVLNGMKQYIANGGVAGLYFILARTDATVGVSRGSTMFVVPAETPGFRIGRRHEKIGFRFYQQAELILENCRVPAFHRVGAENAAYAVKQTRLMAFDNLEIGTHALGIGQAAYEAAFEYAKTRVQGGKPIIRHQAIALMLGEMRMRLEAARSYLYRVAWHMDTDTPMDREARIMVKAFGVETAVAVTRMAVEIFGGSGIMKEGPVEKYLRDAAVFVHLGASRAHRLRAMTHLMDGASGVPAAAMAG
jgi:alkylation response protein AidB-like acyl-CoA dehydrogenase